ncbi:MAG: Cytosolic seryl-tRNA synthetase [Chrysothrix sp. TS-e1954]|nr:MAG: Cytosolic seryl-tRNA synthetase [Chrysothrix sp. TS-e1954]
MVRIIRDKILNHLGVDWVPLMLVGNKSDLRPEQRVVSTEMGKALAEEFKCGWCETSAKYSENVNKAFELMVAEIEKTQNPSEPTGGSKCSIMNLELEMLDINDFDTERYGPRSSMPFLSSLTVNRGGDPKKIRDSQKRRYAPEAQVDVVYEAYDDHKKTNYKASQVRAEINATQKDIGQKKKVGRFPRTTMPRKRNVPQRELLSQATQAKENADELLKKKEDLTNHEKTLKDSALEKEKELYRKLKAVGNYVHDSVPISDNEDNNAQIRTWAPEGAQPVKKDCLSHHEVLTRLDGYDPTRAVKIVGHRGYSLIGVGFFLNRAMVNYGMDFLYSKEYNPNQPPYFMNKSVMAKTAQLEQFDEELYKVMEDKDEANDKYLIATSEQPLSALHDSEWLQDKDLPIKYAGYSTCFRKEAGSHGKDAWGIFRVHQFEKIEQFIFCKPEESWSYFDSMIAASEEFYQSLGLPYQVVAIVSGALNNAASKKLDLEAWFPFQGEYKELVSCSNCTDYQTRELEIRYGPKQQGVGGGDRSKKVYVHALNATLCATQRALCCVLENYQQEDGVVVPEKLRKYIPGEPEFLPYTKDLPKDTTSQKVKGNAPGPKTKVGPAAESTSGKMENLKVS